MNDLIEERSHTHGDFIQGAEIFAQLAKPKVKGWLQGRIDNCQFYGLIMDAVKEVRILNGDPNFPDHWIDKANYNTLGGRLNLTADNPVEDESVNLIVKEQV